MQKILVLLFLFSTFIYASYNPFFTDDQSPQKKKEAIKVIIQKASKPKPARENIKMIYIGFIETNKGRFGLVTFNNKNIVIQVNDSLYNNEKIFKVKKITSNYVLLRDNSYRTQKVYFSSESRY